MLRWLCLLIGFGVTPLFAQNPLEEVLRAQPELWQIATDPQHQVQIIYTQINRDARNRAQLTSYSFHLDDALYFYPASTVKMPTAFLALQRMNALGLSRDTPLRIGADRFPQTGVTVDSTAVNNRPSVAHYINKIFAVSDNDAFNRLYEFLGQNYINTQLNALGYKDSAIKHRLESGFSPLENQYSNPIWFYNDDDILFERPGMSLAYAFTPSTKKQLIRGRAHYSNALDSVVNRPFDFSSKNAIGLSDLTNQLLHVIFPENYSNQSLFKLKDDDYRFLWHSMSQLPRQSVTSYHQLPDNYLKFILIGDEDKDYQLPDDIRILNKSGWAYGFMTDVAYVVDREHEVEFGLSIQILVNANDTFNDGVYEYDTVGRHFMGQLGRAIYDYEMKRPKKYSAHLDRYFSAP